MASWTMEEARGLAVQHVAIMAKLTASKMYIVLRSSSSNCITVVESATM